MLRPLITELKIVLAKLPIAFHHSIVFLFTHTLLGLSLYAPGLQIANLGCVLIDSLNYHGAGIQKDPDEKPDERGYKSVGYFSPERDMVGWVAHMEDDPARPVKSQ